MRGPLEVWTISLLFCWLTLGISQGLDEPFSWSAHPLRRRQLLFAFTVGSGRWVDSLMITTGVGGGSRGIGGSSITVCTGRVEDEDGVDTGICDDAALDRGGSGPAPDSSKPILHPEPVTVACPVNAASFPDVASRKDFAVREDVEMQNLRDVLAKEGRLDVASALPMFQQIADGLEYAWRQSKLTHGNIKPAYIAISDYGMAKLADVGLAQIDLGDEPEKIKGTPQYISPENHDFSPKSRPRSGGRAPKRPPRNPAVVHFLKYCH